MSTKVKVVSLTGEVVLSTLHEHRTQIAAALEERSLVLLSLGLVEEIDLYGVQLLYAARRHADGVGRELHLTGDVPEHVARRLYEGGFVSAVVRDGRELETALHEFGDAGSDDSDA
tara:strand:- start:203 stop:550 length:348 start_codon:yes stop_codon:yes gene_type:complete